MTNFLLGMAVGVLMSFLGISVICALVAAGRTPLQDDPDDEEDTLLGNLPDKTA